MGLKHSEIRKKCIGCEHHYLKPCGELLLEIDWCRMGDVACEDIKTCDKKAMAWVKKDPQDGFLPEDEP
jgi:hypothetical protein